MSKRVRNLLNHVGGHMGEMTFKDAAERYGPAVALILALVLLVTLLPGNAKTKEAEKVKSTGPAAGANGTESTGAGDVSATNSAGGPQDAAASQVGATSAGPAAAAGATQGATAAKAAGGPVQVASVVQAQQGTYACRADGRQAGVSVAMPPCKQYDATKGNGGATAPGVTGTSIKIAYYIPKPNPATEAALKGAGVADDQADVDRIMEVYRKYWNWHAQTYGREVLFDRVAGQADVTDDVGMKAEANKIADQKYFGVIVARGTTGSPMFERTIGQRKVICFACTTTQATSFYEATAGYNFGSLQTVREYYENVAEYVAKRLVGNGRTAEWAGTNVPDYKTKPRKFGVIWLSANQGTVDPGAQEERD